MERGLRPLFIVRCQWNYESLNKEANQRQLSITINALFARNKSMEVTTKETRVQIRGGFLTLFTTSNKGRGLAQAINRLHYIFWHSNLLTLKFNINQTIQDHIRVMKLMEKNRFNKTKTTCDSMTIIINMHFHNNQSNREVTQTV